MDRDFKGVWIPASVWLDGRLSALEKMIYAEIGSLDINNEGCYAKNEYLADFCQCSIRAVTNAVAHLKQLNYITVDSFNGRGRRMRITPSFLRGSIENFAMQTGKKCGADSQNLPKNTPDTLLDEKYIREIYKSDRGFRPPTLAEVKAYCEERKNDIDPEAFIDHYTGNGWKVGKNPMKDWRAAVRQWERNDIRAGRKPKQQQFANKSFDTADLEALFASDLESIVKDGEKNGV